MIPQGVGMQLEGMRRKGGEPSIEQESHSRAPAEAIEAARRAKREGFSESKPEVGKTKSGRWLLSKIATTGSEVLGRWVENAANKTAQWRDTIVASASEKWANTLNGLYPHRKEEQMNADANACMEIEKRLEATYARAKDAYEQKLRELEQQGWWDKVKGMAMYTWRGEPTLKQCVAHAEARFAQTSTDLSQAKIARTKMVASLNAFTEKHGAKRARIQTLDEKAKTLRERWTPQKTAAPESGKEQETGATLENITTRSANDNVFDVLAFESQLSAIVQSLDNSLKDQKTSFGLMMSIWNNVAVKAGAPKINEELTYRTHPDLSKNTEMNFEEFANTLVRLNQRDGDGKVLLTGLNAIVVNLNSRVGQPQQGDDAQQPTAA